MDGENEVGFGYLRRAGHARIMHNMYVISSGQAYLARTRTLTVAVSAEAGSKGARSSKVRSHRPSAWAQVSKTTVPEAPGL